MYDTQFRCEVVGFKEKHLIVFYRTMVEPSLIKHDNQERIPDQTLLP